MKAAKRKKRKEWAKYKETDLNCHRHIYNMASAELTRTVHKSQAEYESRLIDIIPENPKRFFNHVKSFMKTSSTIDCLEINGIKVTEQQTIAEELNKYFSSVMTAASPVRTNLPVHSPKPDQQLHEVEVTEEIVRRKIENLKLYKASGPDCIHVNVLKQATSLAVPLTLIFQDSIHSGKLPQDWRDANVCPIFKKGSRTKTGNYRPVSLTSQVVKLLERIMLDALLKHIKRNKIISCDQHGFQAGCSCITQLLECCYDWIENLDEGIGTDVIYLDFAKAFDSVSHTHLLYKLRYYGIKGNTYNWIEAFLTGRRQKVVCQEYSSSWSGITSGVPQGSILGPVLFLLFVNDMPNIVESTAKLFADDTKVYRPIDSLNDCNILQKDLNRLQAWANTWLLRFNADKCEVLRIKEKQDYNYTLGGTCLKAVNDIRDLGITISKDMKPKKHIEKICSKANSRIGLIRRCFADRSEETVTTLYQSIVRPLLEYGSVVWNPWLKGDINRLERVQKRALALAQEPIDMESLASRRSDTTLVETYKIMNGHYRLKAENFFQNIESRCRGHTQKLRIEHSSLDVHKNIFTQRAVPLWNKLKESTIKAENVEQFKSSLQENEHHT